MRHTTVPLLLALAACGPSSSPEVPKAKAPTAPELVVPPGPLPDPLMLTGVDLHMTLDPRTDRFSGEVELQVALEAPLDGIWLHGQDLEVSKATITPEGGSTIPATWTTHSATGTARLEPETPLSAGKHVLRIEWSAPFATDLSGMFKVEERGQSFALAKSESIQARRALPGFDEPRFKAPYRVKLTVPQGHTVIANGAELSRQPHDNGLETVVFAETDPLPTYLLSLAVGPFESIDGPPIPTSHLRPDPVPVRGHARPGRAADLGVTLHATPPLVRILEDALGQSFPDTKLDIVAAPAWPSGATELAAAITYREQRVLLGPIDNDSIDPAARRAMLSTHAHELVHMWFGNRVTPAWWNDLWLKEGFATWGSALALHTWEPEGGHAVHSMRRTIKAFSTDSLASARSVREPIQGDSDIRNAYDSITYGKGMSIIRMVDQGYGEDVFRAGVRAWLKQAAGRSTTTEELTEVLTDSTGNPQLAATFMSFLDQPGVPYLQMAVDCPKGADPRVTLRQSRYRPRGSTIDAKQTWTLPVCVQPDTAEAPVCTVMSGRSHEVELTGMACPTFVRPNPTASGYYRAGVASAGWTALAELLPELPAPEAWLLVDSAGAGFAAGHTPAADTLAIFSAAAQHSDRNVVTAPFGTLEGWREHMNDDQRARLDAWTTQTWSEARRRVSKPKSPEDHLLRDQLRAFDAVTLKREDARSALILALEARVGGDTSALPSSSAASALQVYAEDRGADPLNNLIEAILTLDEPRLERDALVAPGHLKEAQAREAALTEALSGTLDPRAAFSRIQTLVGTHDHALRAQTVARVKQEWAQVAQVIPRQSRLRMPALLSTGACSSAEADDLVDFLATEAGQLAPGHERTLAQAREKMLLCEGAAWTAQAVEQALMDVTQ